LGSDSERFDALVSDLIHLELCESNRRRTFWRTVDRDAFVVLDSETTHRPVSDAREPPICTRRYEAGYDASHVRCRTALRLARMLL